MQVDLGLSPVTEAKLVEVLEVLVETGTRALEGNSKGRGTGAVARHGGLQGSLYWGTRRGYAGAIMDSGNLRRSLPRQLMSLYASVQAIEGLGAQQYLGYFKFRSVCDRFSLCASVAISCGEHEYKIRGEERVTDKLRERALWGVPQELSRRTSDGRGQRFVTFPRKLPATLGEISLKATPPRCMILYCTPSRRLRGVANAPAYPPPLLASFTSRLLASWLTACVFV